MREIRVRQLWLILKGGLIYRFDNFFAQSIKEADSAACVSLTADIKMTYSFSSSINIKGFFFQAPPKNFTPNNSNFVIHAVIMERAKFTALNGHKDWFSQTFQSPTGLILPLSQLFKIWPYTLGSEIEFHRSSTPF